MMVAETTKIVKRNQREKVESDLLDKIGNLALGIDTFRFYWSSKTNCA